MVALLLFTVSNHVKVAVVNFELESRWIESNNCRQTSNSVIMCLDQPESPIDANMASIHSTDADTYLGSDAVLTCAAMFLAAARREDHAYRAWQKARYTNRFPIAHRRA